MDQFVINDFDFGVDPARSLIEVRDSNLYFKVVGKGSVVTNITTDDQHPWNWLLYPPFLYLTAVPCVVDENGNFDHAISEQDLDDYDIALYAMEHCDVLPCRIQKQGKIITADGMVHGICSAPIPFHVRYEVP